MISISNAVNPASLEENEEILEKLRAWGNLKFGSSESDCDFYRKVQLSHMLREKAFREIELSDAYVENFSETIDFTKRKHVIKQELQQKKDKLELII